MHSLWEALIPIVRGFLNSGLRDTVTYYTRDEVPEIPEGKVVEVTVRYISAAKHSNLPES